jgi:hypothetical protein
VQQRIEWRQLIELSGRELLGADVVQRAGKAVRRSEWESR